MNYRFVNVSFQLPDNATIEEAKAIEFLVKELAARQNLKGTVSFDCMDSLTPTPDAPTPKAA